MLSPVHLPYDTRIFHKEAKSLKKAGYGVVVIAQSYTDFDTYVDGIRVIAVKRPHSKLLHPFTIFKVFFKGWSCNCDVYHCHEPGSLFAGVLLKIFKKSKLIYDSHEYYPDLIASNSFFPTFVRPIVKKVCEMEERVLCKFSDVIITVDQLLATHYGNFVENVVILSNYPIITGRSDVKTKKHSNPIIACAGTLTEERGVFELIRSYEKVVDIRPDVCLLFMGEFIDSGFKEFIINYVNDKKLNGIRFTGHIPHTDVIEHLNKSTIGTALLQPIEIFKNAVPVKLFEYMMCNIPVVISNFKFNQKIVQDAQSGILVDPTNIQEISDALLWLLEHPEEAKQMGENGRRAVEETYNWENMEKRLFEVYEELS